MRKYIICILICAPVLSMHAIDVPNEKRAQELLNEIIAGQGDSAYSRLNDEAKKQLSPAMLNTIFKEIEKQVGKFESPGEWGENLISGQTIYFCDLQFEKMPIRFLVAFDADGKVNTLRFIPVPPSDKTGDAAEIDQTKMEEQPITVVCGEYQLPGLLTLPKNGQKVPVVVLVHGSGPTDRDETVGENKPFRNIAWELAGHGIASVRYDKRTNVYRAHYASDNEVTFDDETVDDALAAIDLAKTFPSIDAGSVYVLGHSLGAMLAPRIAQRAEGRLAGIIMLAGNARPLEDLLIEQALYISSIGNALPQSLQPDTIRKQVANMKKLGTDAFDQTIDLPFGVPASYWAFSNAYHQVEVAKELSLPMLVLQGERDYQVTMEDFEIWRSELSGKPDVTLKSYPALNHLFHEGEGKSTPSEYLGAAKKIPGYVFDDISAWIKDQ